VESLACGLGRLVPTMLLATAVGVIVAINLMSIAYVRDLSVEVMAAPREIFTR